MIRTTLALTLLMTSSLSLFSMDPENNTGLINYFYNKSIELKRAYETRTDLKLQGEMLGAFDNNPNEYQKTRTNLNKIQRLTMCDQDTLKIHAKRLSVLPYVAQWCLDEKVPDSDRFKAINGLLTCFGDAIPPVIGRQLVKEQEKLRIKLSDLVATSLGQEKIYPALEQKNIPVYALNPEQVEKYITEHNIHESPEYKAREKALLEQARQQLNREFFMHNFYNK